MTDPVPSIKEPHLAGRWYPGEADVLARTVRDLLAAGGPPRPGVVAVIVPHAAYQYSGPTAARGLAAAGAGFRRALVLAPSHFAGFRGAAVLPMSGYRTPLGVMPIDAEAVAALRAVPLVRANPAVFMREHALEIELPLLQVLAPECTLVPLLVGALDPGDAAALAAVLRPFLGAPTLVVVSSDMTHYGRRFDFLPVPPSDAATVAAAVRGLDEGALDRIVARDADGFVRYVEETGVTICGREPIEVLLRALPITARGERIAYATSLDVSGEWDHTVSYAAVAFAAAAP
jgi:AmmeMemoRadiSam system protein B